MKRFVFSKLAKPRLGRKRCGRLTQPRAVAARSAKKTVNLVKLSVWVRLAVAGFTEVLQAGRERRKARPGLWPR